VRSFIISYLPTKLVLCPDSVIKIRIDQSDARKHFGTKKRWLGFTAIARELLFPAVRDFFWTTPDRLIECRVLLGINHDLKKPIGLPNAMMTSPIVLRPLI